MRSTFETMGTVASLDGVGATTVESVQQVFERAEARFSLYRPDSELSRVAAGTLSMMHSSAELREAYADALVWRSLTSGAFTPNRPDGVIDLNGIVKAQTMRAAGELIVADGWQLWSLNVGGDILVAGEHPHPTGIVDPFDRTALLCAIELRAPRTAMATSGSAERGDHIWLASTRDPAEFVQVTVVADDIVTADVLATAIVAAGRSGLDEITERWDIDVIAVDRGGQMYATPGIKTALLA